MSWAARRSFMALAMAPHGLAAGRPPRPRCRLLVLPPLLLFFLLLVNFSLDLPLALAHSITQPSSPHSADPTAGFCEARTINFITHALPQSCLTSSWAAAKSPSATPPAPPPDARPSSHDLDPGTPSGSLSQTTDSTAPEPAAASTATTFMSFEDWKAMMIRRAAQDPHHRLPDDPNHPQAQDGRHVDAAHDNSRPEGDASPPLGNDPEGSEQKSSTPQPAPQGPSSAASSSSPGLPPSDDPAQDQAVVYGDGKPAPVRRSKDAGKTCKERFSYSSFDAGATILKASTGAKNARAILVENKDTYMLFECAAPSKYVIVELTDDILVDTIVVANFEFFSSMIRHFRVSVSDRYPVKADRWRLLGTFEARNARDIQPFLVVNPQLWAKYFRIEFLSHYGNEYYCPVSLLRVHGSRMLDSWKESETGRDDDGLPPPDAEDLPINASHRLPPPAEPGQVQSPPEPAATTPWSPPLLFHPSDAALHSTCPAPSRSSLTPPEPPATAPSPAPTPPTQQRRKLHSSNPPEAERPLEASSTLPARPPAPIPPEPASDLLTSPNSSQAAPLPGHGSTKEPSNPPPPPAAVPSGSSINSSSEASSHHSQGAASHPPSEKIPVSITGSANSRPRTSSTLTSSSASPTIQEGFFNAITKRLQQVEANLTLSLKYIEDQSRHVQEALQRGEQKQMANINLFLNHLNQTLLADLRNVRDQYDQIWQSTVLALESQAERSQQDIMALTVRINLLADELVFQKRLAVVQATILIPFLLMALYFRAFPTTSFTRFSIKGPESSPASQEPSACHRDLTTETNSNHHQTRPSCMPTCDSPPRQLHPTPVDHDRTALMASSCSFSETTTADPSPSSSRYRGLSPPLTPSPPGDSIAFHMSMSVPHPPTEECIDNSHDSPNLPRAKTRKQLPPLPEHPSPQGDT